MHQLKQPQTEWGFAAEVAGKTFRHTFEHFGNVVVNGLQPSLQELTLADYMALVPKVRDALRDLKLESYLNAPAWGIIQLAANHYYSRFEQGARSPNRAFLVEDACIAFISCAQDAAKLGACEHSMTYIQPLTSDRKKLTAALAKYAYELGPLCEIQGKLIEGQALGPYMPCYVEREVFYQTRPVADLAGGNLRKRRTGIKQYGNPSRFLLMPAAETPAVDRLIKEWSDSKEHASLGAEYALMAHGLADEHLKSAGIPFESLHVWDVAQGKLAGASYSVKVSNKVWTSLMRLTVRDEYPYLGDFLLTHDARRWHQPICSDGNTNEWCGDGLYRFKLRLVRYCGGWLQDVYYLVLDPEHVRQLSVCEQIQGHIDSELAVGLKASSEGQGREWRTE